MKPLNQFSQLLPAVNDIFVESPLAVQRRIAYTDKYKPIEVWYLIPVYNLNLTIDCIGFALDTFRRYGYNVDIRQAQIVLDDEYMELGNVDKIQVGDLVATLSGEGHYIHFSRIFATGDSYQEHLVIEKRARLKPAFRKLHELTEDFLHPGSSIKIFREISPQQKPWIIDLVEFYMQLVKLPDLDDIQARELELWRERIGSSVDLPPTDLVTFFRQLGDEFCS